MRTILNSFWTTMAQRSKMFQPWDLLKIHNVDSHIFYIYILHLYMYSHIDELTKWDKV